MPLDTFAPAANPSISGTNKRVTPRVRVASFGDGYSQRVGDGLNTMPRIFAASWDALASADADYIEGFFQAKAGVTAFLWTLQDEAVVRKWIVKSWQRGYLGGGNDSISAEFTEVFDL